MSSLGQSYKAARRLDEAKRCAEWSLPVLRSRGVKSKVHEALSLVS